MANESKEIFLPYIRKTILTGDKEQLIDMAQNLLDIVLSNPKAKKELLSMVQVSITLSKPEVTEDVVEPKQPKKEKVAKEKPVKANRRMSDIDMVKAISNELKDVKLDTPVQEPEPADDDNETEGMLN